MRQNELRTYLGSLIRRISVAWNAIHTIENETTYLIIYCLNCIQRQGNLTYKMGLRLEIVTDIIDKLFGGGGGGELGC